MAIKGARAELGQVTPHLIVRDADAAIDFYRRAFGALLLYRFESQHGGGIHARLRIGRTLIALTDEGTTARLAIPASRAPSSLGGTTVMLETYVEFVDDSYERAIEAGATAITEPSDSFDGDRSASVRDPFGHVWTVRTAAEELTAAEVDAEMREADDARHTPPDRSRPPHVSDA